MDSSPSMVDHEQRITLTVNDTTYETTVESRTTLADCLRNQLGLTGTHLGCEHGVCGACTVLVDGRTMRGCLMLAAQGEGCRIMTVEGLAGDGELQPLQQAFWDCHGLQCGFCTPGILMTLTELLDDHPDADEEAIRLALSGHLCRCTGYQNIVAAALAAAGQLRGKR
jgi:2-furoyl-CoA dehydrogenase 2Fe-2S iron sulfur subunit